MNGLKGLQYLGNLVGKGDLTKFPQLPSRKRDLQLFKYKCVEVHIENVIAQENVIP
jgi:hypothetical protein